MEDEEDKFKGLLYSPEVLGGIGLLTQGLSGAAPSAALPSLLQGMQTASLFKKQKSADEKAKFIKQYEDQVPEDQLAAFRAFPEKWVEQNLFAKDKGSKFETFLSVDGTDKVTINTNTKAGLLRAEELTNNKRYNKVSQSITGKTTSDLVPKKTKTDIDQKLMTEYEFRDSFETIDVLFDPKYVTYLGKGEAFILGEAQKLGFKTSKEQDNYLSKFGEWKSEVLKNSNQYRKYITGVAAGGKEIKLLAGTIANPDDAPSVFKAKINAARILNDQNIKRLERYKNEGLGEITLNDKGEPTGKYKEFLEKPENQLQITKEVAVGFVQNLVNGDYSNEQIQLKIKQVFGVENVVKINKLLEDLK